MGKGSRRPLAVGAFVLALLTAVAFIAAITRSDGTDST
jgi:hypothetical protein